MRALLLVLVAGVASAQGYAPRGGGVSSGQVISIVQDAGIVDPITADDVRTVTLGEPFSHRSLILTEADTTKAALTILNGRLYLANSTNNPSAYIQYTAEFGFFTGGGNWFNCAGCAYFTDVIYPRQNGIPIAIGDADGVTIACQSSPGTCDAAHKGAAVCVTETASSATRICRCIRTSSSGDYRWLNTDNSTRGSTTTDCPDTTP